MELQRVVAWCTVAVLVAISLLLGVVCVFMLPPIVDEAVMGRLVGTFVAAFTGNLLAALYAARTTGARWPALATAAAWLVAALFFALGRGEGDTVLLMQTWHGILLPPAAMLGASIGLVRGYRRPWATASRYSPDAVDD